MTAGGEEIIIVRSLADSDMGLFATHRRGATSKQRAIALTTRAARELLDSALFAAGGDMDCICIFGSVINRELRHVGKVGKNWRLGGRQLVGQEFARLDSKDFALIQSVRHNDGTSPILITFAGRHAQRFVQAGLVGTLASALRQSVAIIEESSTTFSELAELFPSVPARVAVRRAAAQPAML